MTLEPCKTCAHWRFTIESGHRRYRCTELNTADVKPRRRWCIECGCKFRRPRRRPRQ